MVVNENPSIRSTKQHTQLMTSRQKLSTVGLQYRTEPVLYSPPITITMGDCWLTHSHGKRLVLLSQLETQKKGDQDAEDKYTTFAALNFLLVC